ncbi:ABC transporter substrate-binding protein [Thermodesulfobacteriota bacterium]
MAELEITAGFATIGQGAGPMIVTQRAGLFAQQGLDVEVRIMNGAPNVIKGLMSGEIQFGNLAAPSLLKAVLLGEADTVFLTGGINQQFLVGRPGLKDRKELSGGKIVIANDNGFKDVLVHFVIEQLKKQGITNVSTVWHAETTMNSLLQGEYDADIFSPPLAVVARQKGCAFLIDFAEYGLNYALGGIAARRSYIEEHPDIAAKFIKAYVAGMHRYRTDRSFTAGVQQEYSGLADRSIAEETYDITQPGMPRVPYPVTSALATALRLMAKNFPLAATADAKRFVEDRFLREIEQSGFIASLYGTKATK